MELKKIEDIVGDHKQRRADRSNFEGIWQEIYEHFFPRRASVYGGSKGLNQMKRIYDSTPIIANEHLGASLQSTLTNIATQWVIIETDDEELNELQEVKEWLEADTRTLRKSLDNSNFYSQAHEMYLDIGSIGMGTLYGEEHRDPSKDFHFSSRHIREVFLSEGDQGERNLVNLEREWTARQIMDRWAKHPRAQIPRDVANEYEKGESDRPFVVLQAIFPNPEYIAGNILNPEKFLYRCEWIYLGEGEYPSRAGESILTDGYHELPVMVPCWARASGEFYGRGPGWTALPDAKVLYAQEKTSLRVGEKIADPPHQAPSGSIVSDLTLTPGGMNYYDPTARRGIEPIEYGANYSITLDEKNQKRESIRNIFFMNNLQIIDDKEMTAEEVRARIAQNARILGPTFGRLTDEFLEVLIERCLGILRRKGKLAPVPEVVIKAAQERGVQLKVRYVSPLVKAQNAAEVQAIQHTTATAFNWADAEINSGKVDTVIDNLDLDYGIRKIGDLDGVPPEFMADKRMVQKMRNIRAEQMKAKAELEQLQTGAEAAGKAAEAGEKVIDMQQRAAR